LPLPVKITRPRAPGASFANRAVTTFAFAAAGATPDKTAAEPAVDAMLAVAGSAAAAVASAIVATIQAIRAFRLEIFTSVSLP
jgi:hypothetical protein